MSKGEMTSMERMARVGSRINAALLEALQPGDWELTDDRGGPTIRYLFAHLAHYRYAFLTMLAPDSLGTSRPALQKRQDGTQEMLVSDPTELKQLLLDGDEAALSAVRQATQRGESLGGRYADPSLFLARKLAHDAHHWGQIMTILRLHGLERPDMNRALYGFWTEL